MNPQQWQLLADCLNAAQDILLRGGWRQPRAPLSQFPPAAGACAGPHTAASGRGESPSAHAHAYTHTDADACHPHAYNHTNAHAYGRTDAAPTPAALGAKNFPSAAPLPSTTSLRAAAPPQSTRSFQSPTSLGSPATRSTPAQIQHWQQEVLQCKRCPLREKYQRQPVISCQAGNPELLIVTAPLGEEADAQHQPLPQKEHDYLLKWLQAIGAEKRYLLTNVLKCLPPSGRNPFPQELFNCLHHLRQQLQHYPFRAVLALGSIAARALSLNDLPLAQLREQKLFYAGLPLVVTYQPGEVLQHPEQLRRPVWQDLQRLIPWLS